MVRHLKASNAIGAVLARSADGPFCWSSAYAGQSLDVKQQIVDMALNASGIRDTARVLHVSPTTVMKELKKRNLTCKQVNHRVLQHVHSERVEVEICRADALAVRRGFSSELVEMWSYVRNKAQPRWLWHAIDHLSGTVLAYIFGRRKDTVFFELKELLRRLVSRGFTPMDGGRISGISSRRSITLGRSMANILGVRPRQLDQRPPM